MKNEINFDNFNNAVETPVFVKGGVRYKTKPLTVVSAARILPLLQKIDEDPSKLPEFLDSFTKAIDVPDGFFDDLDLNSLQSVLADFFTPPSPPKKSTR